MILHPWRAPERLCHLWRWHSWDPMQRWVSHADVPSLPSPLIQALSATCHAEDRQGLEMFANPGLFWQIAIIGNKRLL